MNPSQIDPEMEKKQPAQRMPVKRTSKECALDHLKRKLTMLPLGTYVGEYAGIFREADILCTQR
jgi:hypothetical protein